MTAFDPNLARGGWLRWLGLTPAARAPDGPGDHSDAHETYDGKVRRRQRTLEDISRFLLTHGLPIMPFTLDVAHDVITGSNPALVKLLAARVAEPAPVTLSWLEEALHTTGSKEGSAQILSLVHQLEAALAAFGRTSVAARYATSNYSSALQAHVADLGETDVGSSDAILELAALARGMMERSRDIEGELARSEREVRALQKSLADARRDAEIDHLTGLPNRRAFEAVRRREEDSTRETGEPLCVAFCDIDEFKRINDAHGHDAGDRVLRAVAQSLATISDDRCHVARHGGEEFVVLLRGRSLDEAWAVLDKSRATLAERKLVNRSTDRPFGQISISAGIADVHAYGDAREALRAADRALLRAKECGRNRVFKSTDIP